MSTTYLGLVVLGVVFIWAIVLVGAAIEGGRWHGEKGKEKR